MARASYQRIPNIVLGKPKKKKKSLVKGATFSSPTPYSTPIPVLPKPKRQKLKLKF
jgi:hypothetical protein